MTAFPTTYPVWRNWHSKSMPTPNKNFVLIISVVKHQMYV